MVYGTLTNRVAVDKPVALLSVNGPEFTIILGSQVPGTTMARVPSAASIQNGAFLSGFTLTNGATRNVGDTYADYYGWRIWCESEAPLSLTAGNRKFGLLVRRRGI